MKKYNLMIVSLVLLYLVLALLSGYQISHMVQQRNSEYKVEINRLQEQLSADGVFVSEAADKNADMAVSLDLSQCRYVKKVTFLSTQELTKEIAVAHFFHAKNGLEYQIQPVTREGVTAGYVRYDYLLQVSYHGALVLTEVLLAVMAAGMLGILLYLRQSMILPFYRFIELPAAMANGHLRNRVEESKSRYFGRFIWGIGMLQDRLESDRRKELKLQKEKKMLLLSLSHDIKTPLNNIELYVRALEEGVYDTEEKQQRAIHQIGEKASQIEHFVREIIQTSREEVLDIEVKKGEFYIKELIGQLQKTYQKRCQLSHVAFAVEACQNKLLKGDFHRAAEVLENLMENALKYGDGRTIAITFTEEDYCQLIRVHNTGTPIPEQEFNNMFDSFFRGSNAAGKEGSGLGLYICSQIMRRMDGDIFAVRCSDGMDFIVVFAE